jgi:hypothetical protein
VAAGVSTGNGASFDFRASRFAQDEAKQRMPLSAYPYPERERSEQSTGAGRLCRPLFSIEPRS